MQKTETFFNTEEQEILKLLNDLPVTQQIEIIEDSIADEKEEMHVQVLEGLLLKLKRQIKEND